MSSAIDMWGSDTIPDDDPDGTAAEAQEADDLLTELFGQIERAWIDHHDRMLVYELSEKHPEFRDQLYEFFEDLVLGPSNQFNREIEEAEDRVHKWLQSSGIEIAKAAAVQKADEDEERWPERYQQLCPERYPAIEAASHTCDYCNGLGEVFDPFGRNQLATCPKCKGEGVRLDAILAIDRPGMSTDLLAMAERADLEMLNRYRNHDRIALQLCDFWSECHAFAAELQRREEQR